MSTSTPDTTADASATHDTDPLLTEWLANAAMRRRAWVCVALAAVSSFLFVVDSGFVGLAMPKIEAEFPTTSRALIEWFATGFMVTQASLLLLAGRLGDRHGRKKLFLIGLTAFSLASLLTALAPSLPLIIAARIVCGAAAAFLAAGTFAIVLPMFPAARSGIAVGIWGSMGAVAGWLTPLVGPLLVEHDWRWAFAAITPFGLVTVLIGWRILPEQKAELPPGRTDAISLIVAPPALGLLMLELSYGGAWGWTSTATLTLGVVVITLLTVLVRRSYTAPLPLLDLDLLRNRGYSGFMISGVMQQIGFFSWFITAPLVMDSVWGWKVGTIGLAIAASQITSSIGAPLGGRLVQRYGYYNLLAIGAVISVGGTAWMAITLDEHPNVWAGLVPGSLIFGFGTAIGGTLSSGGAMSCLPLRLLGAGNSFQQLARRMGGAVGVAIAYALLGAAKGPALLAGGRRVWWMVVIVHVLVIPPAWYGDRQRRKVEAATGGSIR